MKKIVAVAALGGALLVTSTLMVNAKEGKKVTELVGYNVTTQVTPKSKSFLEADKNGDGFLTLKEFTDRSMIENEYDVFISMDDNKDDLVDVREFNDYHNARPQTIVQEGSHKNWNIGTGSVTETKYIPVKKSKE